GRYGGGTESFADKNPALCPAKGAGHFRFGDLIGVFQNEQIKTSARRAIAKFLVSRQRRRSGGHDVDKLEQARRQILGVVGQIGEPLVRERCSLPPAPRLLVPSCLRLGDGLMSQGRRTVFSGDF